MRKMKSLFLLVTIAIWNLSGSHAFADIEKLTVAGGCFWCVEADFEKVKGVSDVVSGYMGENGHFEVVEIDFDPAVVTRQQLLKLFVRSIDPTDDHGQFCDRGPRYRTAIFTATPEEKTLAEKILSDAQEELGTKVVTSVFPTSTFHKAGSRHQDYYKGENKILTRFGLIKQSAAYKLYRKGCKRDARVLELWGDQAAFAKFH